jgi:hypothetical protein
VSSSAKLDNAFRVQRVLHAALCMSIVIYVVVAYVISSQPQTEPPSETAVAIAEDPLSSPIFIALAAVAALMVAALPTIRGRFLPPRAVAASLNDPIGDPATPNASRALAKLQSGHIITWALCESVAIYGLVLSLMSKELWPVIPFAAVGLLNMLAYAPRRVTLDEVVREANKKPTDYSTGVPA